MFKYMQYDKCRSWKLEGVSFCEGVQSLPEVQVSALL